MLTTPLLSISGKIHSPITSGRKGWTWGTVWTGITPAFSGSRRKSHPRWRLDPQGPVRGCRELQSLALKLLFLHQLQMNQPSERTAWRNCLRNTLRTNNGASNSLQPRTSQVSLCSHPGVSDLVIWAARYHHQIHSPGVGLHSISKKKKSLVVLKETQSKM